MSDAIKSIVAQLRAAPKDEKEKMLANIKKNNPRDLVDILMMFDEMESREKRDAAQGGLLEFVKAVYPNYKVGAHHKRLAKLLEDAIDGDKKRIIVNIAPRMGKSELVSYLFPAWFLGHHPDKKIIMATHTADLSTTFGRRVRDCAQQIVVLSSGSKLIV